MKSVKEKAEAYDKVLEWATEAHKVCDGMLKEDLEHLFPELKDSEDEKIRKALIKYFTLSDDNADYQCCGVHYKDIVAWLEKQDEHANFRNKIQIGDKVTRNEDGVLVNLSQLNRVAKKQGEQNPAEFDNTNAKRMFIKALERVEEQNSKGYKLTDCDKNSWWEDFKAYTSCTIEQKSAAWSDEDEKQARQIERIVNDDGCTQKLQKQIADWFKSLKERCNWKPSDEQMNALNYVVNLMASSERPTENDLYYNILKSLRQQLMKLKG